MKLYCPNRPRRRRFLPQITQLENRLTLSATVTSLGQDGHDLVGPDASPGSDGIQDLHLQLSGLAGSISQITVNAPGGFQWQTAPDQTGAALAEYFPSTNPGQGDLFLNPQVKSDLPPPGGSLPLGGSTGSLIGLSNGTTLTVTIDYQGQASPETTTVQVTNLVSATDLMPAIATPANVVSSFQVTVLGQDGTGLPYESGFVHLVATAPTGVTFNSSSLNQVFWGISDQAGIAWDSSTASLDHNHVYASLRANTNNVVDLYFPPARNEAPPVGSTAPTMLLQVSVPGDSNVYVTPFQGAAWNVSELTVSPSSQSPPNAPTTEAQLRSDLMSTSPEYDTISLPANQTIVITQPLEITHSVTIIGNNATLLFQQGSTPAWPASASGAIYVDPTGYGNIQLELDQFTIKFDMSAPIRWSNPAGSEPALWDPENNPGVSTHAVIDTRDSNTNQNDTMLTLSGMSIYGPPAFDGASFASLQAQLAQSGDTIDQYVGEQAIDLIRTNDQDFGTISNSTFQGGSIEVFGGPWSITGNTVLGSTADTYSPAAFSLHSPHDSIVQGNQVSQSDPNGREFRLVNLAVSGYNTTIADNSFGNGAGQIGNELSYSANSGQFWGINDPEVILAESSYSVFFEGRPGAVSADGRLLILPDVRAFAAPIASGPGMVVSILAGVESNGAPTMSLAGEYFRVAQQVSLDANKTIELLMQDPLPQMPAGGYYVVEVTGGFVNTTIAGNSIDLTGKSSTGVVLNGEDFGSSIVGNQFIGATNYQNVYTGTAISVTAAIGSQQSSNGPFPLPPGWTALPDLGAIVEGNTIRNALSGIVLGVQHAVNYWGTQVSSSSETGRVYFTASVTQNTFEWETSFLSSWSSAYLADGNNPAQSSTPPTVTIGSGFSAEAPGPYGAPRFPWTVGAAMTENGNDQPIFIDPVENVVVIEGNATEIIAANSTVSAASNLSGQVYAGIVNGVTDSAPIPAQTYNNEPYYPFNLDNLDIAAAPSGTQGIQGIAVGQDDVDLVGPGTGSAEPDGIQDLHLVLTGLNPAETIASLKVIGTAPGEDWQYPTTGSTAQMVIERSAGSTTASLFLAPLASHLDDTFTIELSYSQGGTITIPAPGVLYNPLLPVFPGGSTFTASPPGPPPPPAPAPPSAPVSLKALLVSATQIKLAWAPSTGASSYIVDRSIGGTAWSAIATNVTTPSYADSGLGYSTTYMYRVMAVSNAGQSVPSSVVSTQTGARPDALALQPMTVSATRNTLFSVPVAIFTDANSTTIASRFVATINWGDGTVTTAGVVGGNGYFVVTGAHTYRTIGTFVVDVSVSMSVPDAASASAAGAAHVVAPARAKARVQPRIIRRAAKPARKSYR
ncbi:MAG: hypothetical protein ACLQVF_20840 [Isosphaeraceae bacterium]